MTTMTTDTRTHNPITPGRIVLFLMRDGKTRRPMLIVDIIDSSLGTVAGTLMLRGWSDHDNLPEGVAKLPVTTFVAESRYDDTVSAEPGTWKWPIITTPVTASASPVTATVPVAAAVDEAPAGGRRRK